MSYAVQDLLACAEEAARAAANHALKNEHRRNEATARYAHDVKLLLDVECQKIAEDVIRTAFPRHGILGEEGESPSDQKEPLWIIDPIDGTVNFSRGIPYWCSSVAVQVNGEVAAGAVFAPVLKEFYKAASGQPATCNDKPIRVSDVSVLEQAMAMTGLAKSLQGQSKALKIFQVISAKIQKIRLMGAAALDICQVANGRSDIFFEAGIHLWDMAAAGFILQQAGGRSETLETVTGHKIRYLGTNGVIHENIRRELMAVGLFSGSGQ